MYLDMKRNLIYIYTIIVVAFFASMVSSCEVQDFDWEEARQNNPDYKYEQVCKSVFGEVAPDQSWDFSGFSVEGGSVTRAMTDVPFCIGSKRYMVEDLSTDTETSIGGYKSDIDFNDIVVDFVMFSDGSQKAIIRALGGTLDFQLLVGGTPVFKKSEVFSAETMYNTGVLTDKGGDGNFNYDLVLHEVILSNGQWDPVRNNISFHLLNNLDGMNRPNSELESDFQVYEISFPDPGTIAPRIIALPTNKNWMFERTEIDFINKNNGSENLSLGFKVVLHADSEKGTASITDANPEGDNVYYRPVEISATPKDGFSFYNWSDGSEDAVRKINYDVDLYAYFSTVETNGGILWEAAPVSLNNNWVLFKYTQNGASYTKYSLKKIRICYNCTAPQYQKGQIQMRIGESGNYIWQQYDLVPGTNLIKDITLTDALARELKNSTFGNLFNIIGQYITITGIYALD